MGPQEHYVSFLTCFPISLNDIYALYGERDQYHMFITSLIHKSHQILASNSSTANKNVIRVFVSYRATKEC